MNVQTIILAIMKPVSLGCVFGHWSSLPVLSPASCSEGTICISRGKVQEQSLHVVPCMPRPKAHAGPTSSSVKDKSQLADRAEFPKLGVITSPRAGRVWTAKRGPGSIKETPDLH